MQIVLNAHKLVTAHNRRSKNKQQAFTLIEMVTVIVLISILAAVALPRFLDVKDNAEAASMQKVAAGFSTGLAIAKSQWMVEGNSISTTTPTDSAVNVDGMLFNVNRFGWLDNVTGGSLGLNDQTSGECQQVFDNILQSPPRTTTNTDIESRRKASYAVSVVSGSNSDLCRYELIVRPSSDPDEPTFYFDYELATGRVLLTLPSDL